MRIGFDAKRLFYNATGLGNYSRTLVGTLAKSFPDHEYHLYSPGVGYAPAAASFRTEKSYHLHFAKTPFKAYWRSRSVINDLHRDKIELYHGLSHELPLLPRSSPIKTVVTIHDLIFKIYPKTYAKWDRLMYERKFRYSCERADKIIAISESTKKDIVRFFGTDPGKISVIYQPCEPVFYEETTVERNTILDNLNLPKSFLLYVGSVIERKNLKLIIQALSILAPAVDIPLVVIGKGGRYMNESRVLAQKLNVENRIVWISNLSDNQELKMIYEAAECLVYPSYYEGFGLPVAEALLTKTPVIAGNTSSLSEAGGPDSLYINPKNAEELAHTIEQVLTDKSLKEKMRSKGYAYAMNKFSITNYAKLLMENYDNLVKF